MSIAKYTQNIPSDEDGLQVYKCICYTCNYMYMYLIITLLNTCTCN